MDLQHVIPILKDLGIPAAISAVLLALVKAVSDALQRRSKQSLIDWFAQPSAIEPFKGDDRVLRALHELQQLLVFERAFGLRAESGCATSYCSSQNPNTNPCNFTKCWTLAEYSDSGAVGFRN